MGPLNDNLNFLLDGDYGIIFIFLCQIIFWVLFSNKSSLQNNQCRFLRLMLSFFSIIIINSILFLIAFASDVIFWFLLIWKIMIKIHNCYNTQINWKFHPFLRIVKLKCAKIKLNHCNFKKERKNLCNFFCRFKGSIRCWHMLCYFSSNSTIIQTLNLPWDAENFQLSFQLSIFLILSY